MCFYSFAFQFYHLTYPIFSSTIKSHRASGGLPMHLELEKYIKHMVKMGKVWSNYENHSSSQTGI